MTGSAASTPCGSAVAGRYEVFNLDVLTEMGGCLGEGVGLGPLRDPVWADDGKRTPALDVLLKTNPERKLGRRAA